MERQEIINVFESNGYKVNDKLTQLDFTHKDKPNSIVAIHYMQFSQMTDKILNDFIDQGET